MSKPAAFIVAFLTTLVVVLVPVFRIGSVPTEAQGGASVMPDYEFEVFSGLQNVDNVKLSCRWHGGGCTAPHGVVADGNGLDFAGRLLVDEERKVYVHFKRTKGNSSLAMQLITRTDMDACKGVDADIYLIPGNNTMDRFQVAEISYVHIDAADTTDSRELVVEDSIKTIIGTVASTEWCKDLWNADHLHQHVLGSSLSSVVQPNRDNSNASKGIPRPVVVEVPDPENEGETKFEVDQKPFPCISSSMWLWKISSGTPAVTATEAPTKTCPPTNLKLTSGSALTLEFDSPDDVDLELYKADGSGAFCDADASSCSLDTERAGAASATAMFTKKNPLGVDEPDIKTWPSGEYRARGRGCVGSACGAWSGWSNTIDHIAPPTDPALVSNPSGTLTMRYRSFGVSGSGKHVFRLQRTGLDRSASFCEMGYHETRSCRSAGTREQDPPRSVPGEDAAHSVFFGAHAEGKYRAQAKSCRDEGPARDGSVLYDCGAWSDFSPVIYHMRPPTEMGLVSAAGALGVSFQSLRAAQFQLYRSSGSACTVGAAGCTLVATITAEAAASAGPHTATFGQRAGGTYWVRGQSCLTSGARSSGGVGGAADTPAPRVDTGACGAWSALSPSSGHTASTVTPEPQCTLTVVARPAVGGTVSGGRTVNCSASTNLTAEAKPKPGYRFSHWSGDGTGTGASARTVTMETDRSVTAHFAVTTEPPPEQCTLTVTSTPGGTTSRNITADCGTDQPISAKATSGEKFKHWTGDISSTSKSTTVTLNDDMSVHAVFACKLTMDSGSGGTASGGGLFDCGTEQEVAAELTTGYRFRIWAGAAPSTSPTASVTLNSNKTVTAIFDCLLTVNSGPGGTARGSVIAACDTPQPVTATVTDGHRFRIWTGDLSSTSRSDTITLDGNKTVRANFDCRLTVGSSSGGTASGGGTVECSSSTDLRIRATPSAGNYFHRWYGSGIANVWAASTLVDMSRSRTVTPDFEKYRRLNLSASPSSRGTVSGDGGYRYGARATIRATAKVPASGYGSYFKHWKEGTRIVSTSSTWTFRVYRDRNLIAVFGSICETEFPCGYAQEEPP